MMTSRKGITCIAALALLALVCHAVIGATPDNDRTTVNVMTVENSGDNAPLPDFDGDGTVGFGDFVKFAAKFGLSAGDEGFDAEYDLNGDGQIGFADFVTFAQSFGKEIPSDDRAVLVALYKATDGPNWRFNTNWLSDRPLGEWYGVTTDAAGRVTKLELYGIITSDGDTVGAGSGAGGTIVGNRLTGSIPSALGSLTNLELLDLGSNQLTGTIPSALGSLTNLELLDLGSNQLTGTIPSELGSLANLKWLYLYGNQLTGNIPPELGSLANLEVLYLFYNQLTGNIPPEFGQLTKLEYLTLEGNQLTGRIPAALGNLSKLVELWLTYNQLTGTIPPELGQLGSLTKLDLTGNVNLSGPIPESFTSLALDYLHLSGTAVCVPLTHEFEDWIEVVPRKKGISRCANPERDALIALYTRTNGPNWTNRKNWSTLAPLDEWHGVAADDSGRVVRLTLRDNNLSGLLPDSLSVLSYLKTLDLSSNAAMSGPLPQALTRLALESLELGGTRLCAPPLAEFQVWLNGIPDSDVSRCIDTRPDYYPLVALYRTTDGRNWTNATNWASAAPLGAWHGVTADAEGRVTGLSLIENNLKGTTPVELGQLAHIATLNLSNNQLSGNIPSELGQLANLRGLNLSRNQLSGNVPPELGKLAKLDSLMLTRNKLTGEISAELAQLANLRSLCLDENSFTGNIPPELGNLANLRSLDLSGNPLEGTIPPELGRLRNLDSLFLWYNNLGGNIPPELGNLDNLRRLYLVDNFFTGNIPPELGQLTNLEELLLINNELTGEIPSELGRLANLQKLHLTSNRLSGEIPSELGRLANLQKLYLTSNRMSGNIPPELGNLANLTTMQFDRNDLAGNIPPELGQLTNLEELLLINNELTGEIPSELGRLANLQKLHLNSNRLSGEIPPELGNLRNLTSLNLGFNGALSGTLPVTLTDLTLESLRLDETLLCTPQDAVFRQWLTTITYHRVPNCSRSDEAAAYLVQATQSVEYPVPLVAGKAALLRVFVTSGQDVDVTMPPVRATFYRDGAEVHIANIGGGATNVPRHINEASLLNSANAVVPGAVVLPGLEMVVEIDPDETLDPSLGIASRLPQAGRTGVDVRPVPPFELTLIPFLWEEDPDRSVVTTAEGLSSESDLFRLTRDILPVRDFRLTVHEPVWTSVDPTSDAVSVLGPETELIYAMEGASGYYMAIFRSVGESGLQGIAQLPGYVSLSILDGNVIAHELGHNLNLWHAPACGAGGPDPEYPHEDGSIGEWGYDFVNETLVSPETSDIMTYCTPQWISGYSFAKALARRTQAEGAPLAAAKAAPSKALLIWGGLDGNEKLFLEPAFVVSAPPSLPLTDGPYLLAGEDEAGHTLFSLPFDMPEYGCGSKGGSFAFILPVEDDWSGRLARIALSGPEGADFLDGEDDPAAALLLDRATGDVRGILRDWAEAAAKRPAASLASPELEVLTSYGIPDAASWVR